MGSWQFPESIIDPEGRPAVRPGNLGVAFMKEIELKMNEMCELLGLTPQAIRLYEKHQAIHSFKYEGNGYRYYYFEDVGPAIYVRHLRKFGFSLPQASELVQGSEVNHLTSLLEAQEKKIEKEIAYQQAMLKRCRQLKEMIPDCFSHLHEFSECIRPAMYFLPCERNGKFLQTAEEKETIRGWSQGYPFVYFCPMTESELLNQESVTQLALCLFEQDKQFLEEEMLALAEYVPAHRCIGGVTRVSEHATEYYSVLEDGLEYMKDHGYELTGRIYSILLASSLQSGDEKADYYYIWYEYR